MHHIEHCEGLFRKSRDDNGTSCFIVDRVVDFGEFSFFPHHPCVVVADIHTQVFLSVDDIYFLSRIYDIFKNWWNGRFVVEVEILHLLEGSFENHKALGKDKFRMVCGRENMCIVEESPRWFEYPSNSDGPDSEEVGKFVSDSLDEPFADHHRSFGRTDEHIVSGYIHNSGFYFQTDRQALGSEKHFRKPTGIEPDFRFRTYHKGFDIGEQSWVRGGIGTNRFSRVSELRKLPEDPEKECGHKNGCNRREYIPFQGTEVLKEERVRHHRY